MFFLFTFNIYHYCLKCFFCSLLCIVDKMSVEHFDKNLPDTVQLLTTPNGSKVYLVGTAHFSLESQDDVSKVSLF